VEKKGEKLPPEDRLHGSGFPTLFHRFPPAFSTVFPPFPEKFFRGGKVFNHLLKK